MDITKAASGMDGAPEPPEDAELEGDEEESDEDADISVAIGSDDPERIAAFRDAVRACVAKYGSA